jgi:hypothetical protein
MATPTIKGLGVVWGIGVPGAGGTAFGAGALIQSAHFGVEAESVEVKNAIGDCVAMSFFNQKQTLTVEVIPSGAAISNANGTNLLPLPGTAVTILVADINDAEVYGTQGGKFIFMSGTKNKSNVGVTTLTFNLTQFVDNDVSATISS